MTGEGLRVEGNTVDEAIEKAAALLKVAADNLVVEVVDQGQKDLSGFQRKPAVIIARIGEITVDDATTVEEQGKAWIEDGKIYTDAVEKPAIIIPGEHFDLYINGRHITGEVKVKADDIIEVKPWTEKTEGHWKVSISLDGLKAEVEIKPSQIRTWKLIDQPPATPLILEGEIVETYLPALTTDMLMAELGNQGIVYGIDDSAIQEACEARENKRIVIATGLPAEPGEDARVECLFMEDDYIRVEVDDKERVDYREMIIRSCVSYDQLLAVKVPPRLGKPGKTVTGKPIDPPEPKDIELVAGKGTEVIDGMQIVSKSEGRPQLRRKKGKASVDIINVLLHNGDVDLSSGNIKFKGSVNITGNVTDTMQVTATQEIYIGGDVTEAVIKADGAVIIRRNCISSSVTAGGLTTFFKRAEPILEELYQQLTMLQSAHQQLVKGAVEQKVGRRVDMGYLVSVLVENKFKKIPLLVAGFRDLTKGIEGQQLVVFAEELSRLFKNSVTIQGLNQERLNNLISTVEKIYNYCQEIPENEGDITLSYCLNSKLRAGGKVIITGKGSINSDIIAGDTVTIQGVFRGGSIIAGNNVQVGEIGSPGGARTHIQVAEGKIIKANKVWQNCILQIGKRICHIDIDKDRVLAYINSEDNLVLGGF